MRSKFWLNIPLLAALAVAMFAVGLTQAVPRVSAAASLQLPTSTVPQGALVPVTGSGFTSPDNAVVYIDAPVAGQSRRIQASAIVNANGTFLAHLMLPRTVSPGTYTLTARDAHGVSSSTHLTILALLVVQTGGPSTSTTVVAHSALYVDALGFMPNETVRIQVTFHTYSGNDVVVSRSATADSSGHVYHAVIVPPAGAKIGYATVTATGDTSNKVAPGRVYIVYRGYIVVKNASVTVGSAAGIVGRGFVSYSDVQVRLTINSASGQQTVSVNATTDVHGDFTKYITIPGYTKPGTYSVVAVGVATGIRHYAKLNIVAHQLPPTPKPTARPTAQPTARPTVQPTPKPLHSIVSALPKSTLPNQIISFAGTGFPANSTVAVTATVDLRGGGNRLLSKSVFTDSNGNFSTSLQVPYKAAQGTYTVMATSGSTRASSEVTILPFSAHPRNLNFEWTSLWYHTVRHGTYDVITIQSTLQTTLGIWGHVIFPSGSRLDYYTNTDGTGRWSVKFAVPNNAISPHSNQVYITLQLWHGSQTTQAFIAFTLV